MAALPERQRRQPVSALEPCRVGNKNNEKSINIKSCSSCQRLYALTASNGSIASVKHKNVDSVYSIKFNEGLLVRVNVDILPCYANMSVVT